MDEEESKHSLVAVILVCPAVKTVKDRFVLFIISKQRYFVIADKATQKNRHKILKLDKLGFIKI